MREDRHERQRLAARLWGAVRRARTADRDRTAVGLLDAGMSVRTVAARLGTAPANVQRARERVARPVSAFDRAVRQGGIVRLSEWDDWRRELAQAERGALGEADPERMRAGTLERRRERYRARVADPAYRDRERERLRERDRARAADPAYRARKATDARAHRARKRAREAETGT